MSEQDLHDSKIDAHLVGVEVYFDDLPAAKHFYQDTLGLSFSGGSKLSADCHRGVHLKRPD